MSRGLKLITIKKQSLKNFEKMDKKLLGKDLILMLLSISPIKGNTKLQKQVFLAWKTIFNDVTVDLGFFPWMFGAYSKAVEDSTRILLKQGYIRMKPGRGEGLRYSITPKGLKKIRTKLRELRIGLRDLPEKKIDWDEWSTKGILRHVYRNYPQYTTKTKVPSLKW